MVAIFTYDFPLSQQAFAAANCKLATLSNYSVLIDMAIEMGFIQQDSLQTLEKWRKNPETWNK